MKAIEAEIAYNYTVYEKILPASCYQYKVKAHHLGWKYRAVGVGWGGDMPMAHIMLATCQSMLARHVLANMCHVVADNNGNISDTLLTCWP